MPEKRFKGCYLRFFNEMEIEDVHSASLQVLERIGLRVDSDAIDGGAEVDEKARIVPQLSKAEKSRVR